VKGAAVVLTVIVANTVETGAAVTLWAGLSPALRGVKLRKAITRKAHKRRADKSEVQKDGCMELLAPLSLNDEDLSVILARFNKASLTLVARLPYLGPHFSAFGTLRIGL
jgi:hypothetical protein